MKIGVFRLWLWAVFVGLSRVTTVMTKIKVAVVAVSQFGSPYDIERTGPAIHIAIEQINRELSNSSHQLVVVERHYGNICSAATAPGIAAELYYREGIAAFIGPSCAYALDPVGRLASYWNIPVVTGLGDGGQFKNKTNFPTLTRFAYCQCRLRKVFGSVFAHFNWTDIAVIFDKDDVYSDVLGNTLNVGLKKGGIDPHVFSYRGMQPHNFSQILAVAARKSRVFLLIVPGEAVRQFLLKAQQLGYINGEFVFMDVEMFPFPGDYWGNHSWRRGDNLDETAKKAYQALLRISLHNPVGPAWDQFSSKVKDFAKRIYNFTFKDEEVNFFVGAFYDATILYGKALVESLSKGSNYTDGYTFTRLMWNRTFTGVTGEVFMDDNGDRDTSYSILDMDPKTGEFRAVAEYLGDKPVYNPIPGRNIHWPGGYVTPPPNKPRCGFLGDDVSCIIKESIPLYFVVLLAAFGITVVLAIIGFLLYRKKQFEDRLNNMSWRVNYEDIKFTTRNRADSGVNNFSSAGSVVSSVSGRSRAHSFCGDCQCYTKIAIHKGLVVALKKAPKQKIDLTRDVLMELRQMRDIQHQNVIRFVGACIDPSHIFILVEYCNRGSLQDVLAQDTLNLDWQFRLSLVKDLVRGMLCLHSSEIKSHGRLTSSNCVVDGRLVLKITDFGLNHFYGPANVFTDTKDFTQMKKLLWRAPEHLRKPMPVEGTQKGDIYSFGIILEEVALKSGPYDIASVYMTPEEIVNKVRKGEEPPFRPDLRDSDCLPLYRSLMERCLMERPNDRPDFHAIFKVLKSMQDGKHKNILETLLHRMEQYANNLESIVEERTHQLEVEKKRSEALLHQILPRSIADDLKLGRAVIPEAYQSVTIYFSDVVGFTALSSESTPLEVVNFLNDLYTTFDAVIDRFDVYKVETIGDAYMVVSGLPVKNGNRHVAEIAKMSLALLSDVQTFKIHHRPEDKLRVRIGIHTGPCVAGVVGLKMPRYCLFGDTVNTSSRMESTSEDTKNRSYTVLTENKERNRKGKGSMTTYWLVGEKPLRSMHDLKRERYLIPPGIHEDESWQNQKNEDNESSCIRQS